MGMPRWLMTLPPLLRFAVIGALTVGVLGGVVGLVLGLRSYPPTAWAATVEVGLPGAVLGGLAGVLVGTVARHRRRYDGHD